VDNDVLEFLRAAIKTVWSLELLLLMRRTHERAWTRNELERELRGSANLVGGTLSIFVQAGLVRDIGAVYQYGPASPEIERLVEALVAVYSERPSQVINAILEAPNDKLTSFANAFRLKRD
jgi:hypothetical protein